jgi:hypothetical protein
VVDASFIASWWVNVQWGRFDSIKTDSRFGWADLSNPAHFPK